MVKKELLPLEDQMLFAKFVDYQCCQLELIVRLNSKLQNRQGHRTGLLNLFLVVYNSRLKDKTE